MADRKMTNQYLEDYAVGQVYHTGRLRIDKEQILAFAAQFDLNPTTSTRAPPASLYLAGSQQAAGTPQR